MNKITFSFITLSMIFIVGCKKKSINEQETITTIEIKLTEASNTTSAVWKDMDGAGGKNPMIDTLILDTSKTYTGTIILLDETKTPQTNISNEIEKEREVHQFFYTPQGNISKAFTINTTDKDSKNLPVGLAFKLISNQSAGIGSLRIVLSHYDGVVKSIDPSNESDIDVEIPVKIR